MNYQLHLLHVTPTYDILIPHKDTLLKTSLEKITNRETKSTMRPPITKQQFRNPKYSLIHLNYSQLLIHRTRQDLMLYFNRS